MSITCLLPAAGASSRMRGGDKLLEDVGGKPCLVAMAERALAAGLDVIVTLPSTDHPRAIALGDLPLCKITVPDAALGMSASLKAGARAIKTDANGMMILPPDMPNITSTDMKAMAERFAEISPTLLRARAPSGKQGHPIIFAKKLLSEFADLKGDTGAQPIVRKYKSEIAFLDFNDESPLLDLDTPEEWAAWRASL